MINSHKNTSIKDSNINFSSLAKKEKRGRVRIRLLALSHLQGGMSHRKTAKILQVSPVSIQNWINRFRNLGIEGVKDQTSNCGRYQMLPKSKEKELKELVLKAQKNLTGGRIIGDDIIAIIKEKYGIIYSSSGIYSLMERIGLVWISSRSQHPKSDKKNEKFKEDFSKEVRQLVPKSVDIKNVDIWFQDEARIGQQGTTTRMWAEKGTRPRAIKQLQFTNAYIFGAVCPNQNLSSAIIMPHAMTISMQKHLEEISKVIPSRRHAVIILDRASWHTTNKLNTPSNITLMPLPPYAPELNPIEQVWQFLRNRYLANRCFSGYDDILESCADAWNKFTSITGIIKSLCTRSWATC